MVQYNAAIRIAGAMKGIHVTNYIKSLLWSLWLIEDVLKNIFSIIKL